MSATDDLRAFAEKKLTMARKRAADLTDRLAELQTYKDLQEANAEVAEWQAQIEKLPPPISEIADTALLKSGTVVHPGERGAAAETAPATKPFDPVGDMPAALRRGATP